MNTLLRSMIVSASALMLGCAPAAPSDAEANAEIDSLNVRLSEAYRAHDPAAYAGLFTDSALFEWPAFDSPRGPAELQAMATSNWSALRDMDLRLTVSTRTVAPEHATEFGAFEQSWSDSTGARMAEYGRYASLFLRQPDGSWKMHRFLGFEDSTRALPPVQ